MNEQEKRILEEIKKQAEEINKIMDTITEEIRQCEEALNDAKVGMPIHIVISEKQIFGFSKIKDGEKKRWCLFVEKIGEGPVPLIRSDRLTRAKMVRYIPDLLIKIRDELNGIVEKWELGF